jgi:hypothetical protein
MEDKEILSEEQVTTFLRDGVLVVDLLSDEEVKRYQRDCTKTLASLGVITSDGCWDEASGKALSRLSSTNGSGGVLDIFYPDWKMDLATHPRFFAITRQLWNASFCHQGEAKEDISVDNQFKWHPYGKFDTSKGYAYIDRIGYRIPTKISIEIGEKINAGVKKKKQRALQRSLTPHLDCCPETLYKNTSKWRPIQSFISLTDNLEANTGGFEAARGFHREFQKWSQQRPPTITAQRNEDGTTSELSIPPPCIGQYTHIRPKEDKDILTRVGHIPVKKGSAVFWDNRVPHANAYKHIGDQPRMVIYASFLPDIELNRAYVQHQLDNWKNQEPPNDTWINLDAYDKARMPQEESSSARNYEFTELGRKLMGIDPW